MEWFTGGRRGGKTATTLLAEAEDRVQRLERYLEAAQTEKALLLRMLEDAHERLRVAAGTAAQIVATERHNATYQATTEWAVAQINAITIERGSLIDFLKSGVVDRHPTPLLEWQAAAPPPGPIVTNGVVGGVPIPNGQSAGDVVARLRARRDEQRAARPVDPAELLKAAADIFSDTPEGTSQDVPTTDPFSEVP